MADSLERHGHSCHQRNTGSFSILAMLTLTLLMSALSACSSVSQPDDHGFAVDTQVLSTAAGIDWRYTDKTGFVVKIREHDGTNRDLSWSPQALSDTESLHKLRYCFEQARDKLRFTDREVQEAPGFYELLINKCADYANLKVFDEIRLADQREFDVWIKAGNAYNHMPYIGPIMGTSSNPLLSAKRKIRQLGDNSDAARAATDVKDCVNKAADKGVFDTMSVTGGDMSYASASIQPFLNRFDKCMRDRKYEVELPSPANGSRSS